MKKDKQKWVTYILENKNFQKEGQGARRYYIGRTTNLDRRMKEHLKDGRICYNVVFLHFGDIEKQLKKFGATKFMNLSYEEQLCLTDSIENIRRLKKSDVSYLNR